jgi:hypothetical protein
MQLIRDILILTVLIGLIGVIFMVALPFIFSYEFINIILLIWEFKLGGK